MSVFLHSFSFEFHHVSIDYLKVQSVLFLNALFQYKLGLNIMESLVVFKLSSLIFYKLIYNGKQTGLTTKFLKRLSTEALCTVETQL